MLISNLGNKHKSRRQSKTQRAIDAFVYMPIYILAVILAAIGGLIGQYLIWRDRKKTLNDL